MTSDIIGWTLAQEGGWSDRADDHGGPTQRGITLPSLSRYLGRTATKQELHDLTLEETRAFYWWYMKDAKVDAIAYPALRLVAFDTAVNAGASRAWKCIQEALGFKGDDVDGVPGPQTMTALARRADLGRVALLAATTRARWIGRIISGNMTDADHDGKPDNAENAAGWLDRAMDLIEEVAS